MKQSNIGPTFACLYPGLCTVARGLGYSLAIHGSVTTDLDLVAIPWTEEAVEPEALMNALMDHTGACHFRELIRDTCKWATPEQVEQIVENGDELKPPHTKPHGRLSWNLYMSFGVKIDLSVMPKASWHTATESVITHLVQERDALRKCVADCYMRARREISRLEIPVNMGLSRTMIENAKIPEAWNDVIRFCEATGEKSSILRDSVPTEITGG